MAELAARAALDGLDLPLTAGRATLAALPEVAAVSVAPFRGREADVSAALGVPLPAPGATAPLADGRVIWAGIGLWLVRGPAAERLRAMLAGPAAVADQGDGWCGFALGGEDAGAVLAWLVPVDADPAAFPPEAVARTRLRDVPCLLLRTTGFEILVTRSYARAAAHDLAAAMRAVAGRAALKA